MGEAMVPRRGAGRHGKRPAEDLPEGIRRSATEVDDARAHFLNASAHELKTPLAVTQEEDS